MCCTVDTSFPDPSVLMVPFMGFKRAPDPSYRTADRLALGSLALARQVVRSASKTTPLKIIRHINPRLTETLRSSTKAGSLVSRTQMMGTTPLTTTATSLPRWMRINTRKMTNAPVTDVPLSLNRFSVFRSPWVTTSRTLLAQVEPSIHINRLVQIYLSSTPEVETLTTKPPQ